MEHIKMTAFLVLICCVVLALLLPAKLDPAIRLKEWNEKHKGTK